MSRYSVTQGDSLHVLRNMQDNSVDAVVTDPPYGLSFMGKRWDYDVPSVELWAECLRVLKPGGHLLAFAGTRTQHRMAVRIEDAGFEIRDMIAWIYGSGFPKSLDVSKAIDKAAGSEREVVGPGRWNHVKGSNHEQQHCLIRPGGKHSETAPATEAASQWQGWGTALKPALEPITVARKPLAGTVAENVLAHGTGALNIDGCRVGDFVNTTPSGVDRRNAALSEAGYRPGAYQMGETTPSGAPGRWPANLIHDGSEEVLAAFPWSKSGSLTAGQQKNGGFAVTVNAYGKAAHGGSNEYAASEGSAARFFYCAKASKRDRGEWLDGFAAKFSPTMGNGIGGKEHDPETATPKKNIHPTVKPTDLMRYLCRLVTPPGGVVLDPFTGSGSTGKAAVLEGFRFIGIEREEEYVEIAKARIALACDDRQKHDFDGQKSAARPPHGAILQADLFGGFS